MNTEQREVVILLHGLGRRAFAMRRLQKALSDDYLVVNESYPSHRYSIVDLAEIAITPIVKRFHNVPKIHFVTHSLGGILVRQYCHRHRLKNLGRTVMLGPPNQGSELADFFKRLKLYRVLNGPAGLELGTDPQSIPLQLGSVDFEVGVIAGNKSFSPLYSRLIDGENDGKVSVESSKVEGMKDHIVMPVTHTFMMQNTVVIKQVKHYLSTGKFSQ
jgi:triacylglycerol esterase/lipase EstA (alpha/beta hydrolase family)